MKLKKYQQATLDVVQKFFAEARITGAKSAYKKLTEEKELAARLRGYVANYKPVAALPDVPYVCLRLPTGGGKTILAAHSIQVIKDAYLEEDFPLVLWLVPTNTIRLQTAEALKNPRHPYRQVLDEAFEGRVRVYDIADFTEIKPHDLRANVCIILGTIQTLRVTNKDGRKVYAHHEMLESHFSNVSPNAPGLMRMDEKKNEGDIRFSFANLLHLHQPLVIMDEAHKAGSTLSQEVYQAINPTALIEFTATPKDFNNLLYSVSAQELKDEQMIKMPVVLAELGTWQAAVNSAIVKRAELQAIAELDREAYIRPIVLFQAQKKNEEVTVEVLKQHLIENENIDPQKIAMVTGAQRELDGINLFDTACPIEYVITIEALKEGWDCSFAYVFCSVANIRSSTDAEQLIGRVLRMPYAIRRKSAELNKSYARLVSKSFMEAANSLRDKLVDMGFEKNEAEANIEHEQVDLVDDLFGNSSRPKPEFKIEIAATPEELEDLKTEVSTKVKISTSEEGKTTIQIKGFLKPEEKERLLSKTPESVRPLMKKRITEYEAKHVHELAPAQRGESFIIPRLMAQLQGEMIFGDTDVLMEYHEWSLRNHTARLSSEEFDIVETADYFEIDLDGDRFLISNAENTQQLLSTAEVADWTPASLVQWLDRKIRDQQISQVEMLAWLGDVVNFLIRDRNIPLSQLMRCKFILARKLDEKLKSFRQLERNKAYQASLFGPEARVELSFETGFSFSEDIYADVPKYRGTKFKYRKHFMGPDEVPAFDGKAGGEEEQCAFILDSLPSVKYWTRNVSRHRKSFYLPTSTDRFYPDFVAQLEDGRILVVEYKGKDRTPEESRDSQEKNLIGIQWGKASQGKAVFVMATMIKKDPNEIRTQILDSL